MLITTSRKPSQRTRSFCKSLVRVLNSSYTNRGKMSLRDVLIKSSEMGYDKTAVISQMKGNPSRIDFHKEDGELILSLDITVGLENSSGSKSRVNLKDLKFYSDLEDIEGLSDIFNIPSLNKGSEFKNLMLLKGSDENSKGIIEFYAADGSLTGPKIFIKGWRQ
jgi:U3 small nucleolar ribonucleoprotein protein IMP4